MLEPGDPIPDVGLVDHQGHPVRPRDWHGRWTALWWYVKADTPG